MSVELPGVAIFVGGTLCSTVYNRGGSECIYGPRYFQMTAKNLDCEEYTTSPTPKMHKSDLCPFVLHVSVRVILGEAVRYVLSMVWSINGHILVQLIRNGKFNYQSLSLVLSLPFPLPLPPSLSLSLSLSFSKTDHLLTSLASHVGVKDVLEEDKEGINCEGRT